MKKNKIKQVEFSLEGLKNSVDKNKKVNAVEKAFDSVSEKVFDALNAGYSKSQVLKYLQEQGLDISYNTFNKYLKLHQSKPVAAVVQDVEFDDPQFERTKDQQQWGGV